MIPAALALAGCSGGDTPPTQQVDIANAAGAAHSDIANYAAASAAGAPTAGSAGGRAHDRAAAPARRPVARAGPSDEAAEEHETSGYETGEPMSSGTPAHATPSPAPSPDPSPDPSPAPPAIATLRYGCADGTVIALWIDRTSGIAGLRFARLPWAQLSDQRPAAGLWFRGEAHEVRGTRRQVRLTRPAAPVTVCRARG